MNFTSGKNNLAMSNVYAQFTNRMLPEIAQNLSTKFSASELQLIGEAGLIGENGLIGTNGIISTRNYSGIPESILWQLMKKRPGIAQVTNSRNTAMNAILYRLENMIKYGVVLQNSDYVINYRYTPTGILFNTDDNTVRTIRVYMPFFNNNTSDVNMSDISWTDKSFVGTFTSIFLQFMTEFNIFCDKAVSENVIETATTTPSVPSPTIVKDTINTFKTIIDSSALNYTIDPP